jgi:UDP-3-O-[3-hydroxymyristoyl] glucosamine N-acyltransferase
MKNYTIQEINAILNGEIIGTTTNTITAPEQLEVATENEISFIGNKRDFSSLLNKEEVDDYYKIEQ